MVVESFPRQGRARLPLATECFLGCHDLAEAVSGASQVSKVLVTVLTPCIAGNSDAEGAGLASVSTMEAASRGAENSCGSIDVTRPRSLKMLARMRCSALGPGRGTRMARLRKRRISLTVL